MLARSSLPTSIPVVGMCPLSSFIYNGALFVVVVVVLPDFVGEFLHFFEYFMDCRHYILSIDDEL